MLMSLLLGNEAVDDEMSRLVGWIFTNIKYLLNYFVIHSDMMLTSGFDLNQIHHASQLI